MSWCLKVHCCACSGAQTQCVSCLQGRQCRARMTEYDGRFKGYQKLLRNLHGHSPEKRQRLGGGAGAWNQSSRTSWERCSPDWWCRHRHWNKRKICRQLCKCVCAHACVYSRTEANRKTVLLNPSGQLILIIPIMFAYVMLMTDASTSSNQHGVYHLCGSKENIEAVKSLAKVPVCSHVCVHWHAYRHVCAYAHEDMSAFVQGTCSRMPKISTPGQRRAH